MQQQTLDGYVDSGPLWGTDTCPQCKKELSSEHGVKLHYSSAHGERYTRAWLRDKYGVPVRWLLSTLHTVLEKSVLEMSRELPVSRRSIQCLMDEVDVSRRDQSEAEQLKWDRMSPEQREAQVAAAHEKTRELFARGEGGFQVWERENPEEARQLHQKLGERLHEVRNQNGMEGRTGPDSPTWRGGYNHRRRIMHMLPGRPFYNTRQDVLERDGHTCQMCGDDADDMGQDPHVHHIVPVLCGGTNATELLITLCPTCHITAEHHTYNFTDPLLVESFGR